MAVGSDDRASRLNVEIKARTGDHDRIRKFLRDRGADYRGIDHQRDTYLRVPDGRLKIREGTIENCIVFYHRDDIPGPKNCHYHIEQFTPDDPVLARMRELLSKALGVLCVVDKRREIYYIGNVKFHLDTVENLGAFFEIEAIDTGGKDEKTLRKQCGDYLDELEIPEDRLIDVSYSDLLLGCAGDSR
ncbi:class IV adenylate cyclase [bacterium]|nr:class IV adenylate cyclase [bacterium]